jgi:hypothetical protein
MLLRASGQATGNPVDLRAVTAGTEAAAASGVAHAEALVRFAEAEVGDDDDALARARQALLEAVGPEGLVDAAAVASNFERMVRIADATGIPVDGAMEMLSVDIRKDLDLARFGGARNTPTPSPTRRLLARVMRPVAQGALRLMAARRRS